MSRSNVPVTPNSAKQLANAGKGGRNEYQYKIGTPAELSKELHAIQDLLIRIGHVRPDRIKRNLPKARLIAIVRSGKKIVAVCALKGDNATHMASIVADSHFELPKGSQELGYAATDEQHRGRGLGKRLNRDIVDHAKKTLFATVRVGNTPEENNLRRCGFDRKGESWIGEDGNELALWVRVNE